MSDSSDEKERAATVAQVASKLFGQQIDPSNVIDELLERATSPLIKAEKLGEALR